ncbi:MAG TPA: MSMEG_0569 family flavin-dependent oxidoreductase [Solirubrobacteraceae bacterium]|jgi:putative flavoprotein involved in K+ transport|nr:MSMEG_0569 family flavin-dependent oxidoreductase [Solirubrobacteraceae bacterium]
MPEVSFTIRWPDGTNQLGHSPSRAIQAVLTEGAVYRSAEFLRRAREGLSAASERVRERYGFACSAAAEQLRALEAGAARQADDPDSMVVVERLRVDPPSVRFPPPERLDGHHDVVVVGGGQAGLAVSWCLRDQGVEHVILERHRVGHAWREERWDAFCLVTPNWQCQLPGHPYRGTDPDGFMVREEILGYLDGYVETCRPPLYEGVRVTEVAAEGDGFRVSTSHGTLTADRVVLAVGGYHLPSLPRIAERLPVGVTQLHSSTYKNPSSLPDGGILVVGSGQSGAQIAEDLLLAGRDVHLCVGSAPRVARFYRGRDCVAWLDDIGHYRMPIDEHPQGLAARREPNHYVTGRDGGRDIDLRRHAASGMKLHGRLLACDGGSLSFAGDLRKNLDVADATAERIKDSIDRWIAKQAIDAPTEERYTPVWEPTSDAAETVSVAQAGIRTVIWSTGFRSDWSWVKLPAFDGAGYPTHHRGVTSVDGLYVVGLPWLHTWGSGRFAGIARDAAFIGEHIAERAGAMDERSSAAA